MEFNIFYKETNGWYIGHIQEYPDYESQGRTLRELKENLIEELAECAIDDDLPPDFAKHHDHYLYGVPKK